MTGTVGGVSLFACGMKRLLKSNEIDHIWSFKHNDSVGNDAESKTLVHIL